ncbi:unnamed protein product [Cylindrotheca closterium]|uniref:Uncharacterized protein n=1 Tax=Cylindrotheca closterium TaxID=2856 RepID=A0AAD2CSE6_9STRA|nr:unnamed protein product [Cylindrotheca closterium]
MTDETASASPPPVSSDPKTTEKPINAARRRRNRKKKNKSKQTESQKEQERQKELEFSKMNNHAKLRSDLIQQGFSAEQIDAAMDEMWNQNMPYDEYDHVLKYLKEGKKMKKNKPNNDGGGVEETKEVEATDLTPSQVNNKPVVSVSSTPKRNNGKSKSNLNSMAARLDLVAGFDNLADAIFAMTEWIIKAAKPNELEELCASVSTVALSKIIRRSITESSSAQFESTILPGMVRLLENLLQKCGMPASDNNSNSFPSILQQARTVYQMKKTGSEGIPQRVAEFMVARMYVILKESRISNAKNVDSTKLFHNNNNNKAPATTANGKGGIAKKGFAAMYSERETHRIVAKQFGAAALASCRAIVAASNGSNGSNAQAAAEAAAKTDIFSAIVDDDTNAAFHQHEFMYTELKAQVNDEENKEGNHQALVGLRSEFEMVQTERNLLATQIEELQKSIAKLEAQDQELVHKQFKIQEEMDDKKGQQSDETKKLNQALQEASVQLQSDEYVRSLVDLLKDFDDALAERSVQAISQGASPQENASKAMDFYLTRAKNYFQSEASLFQLLQKRIVNNQTQVAEMKREIEMCQGLGMTTTISQMEEDINSKETMVIRDKALVSRIRSDSAGMFDELMVWLEAYNTARDKDPNRLVPISDKIIQGIPPETSKLEVPNGDRLDAFLAIHDIVSIQPPEFSFEPSEAAKEEGLEETKKEAAPKFTWAKSPTNVANTSVKKSLLDIQKEELESKKQEGKVEEALEATEEKPASGDAVKQEEEENETPKTVEPEKAPEPEKAVAPESDAKETSPEPEKTFEPETAVAPESDPQPEETITKPEEEAPKEAEPKAAPLEADKPSTPAESTAPAPEAISIPSPEEPASDETPSSEARDPLLFPCFLAPPTGTTLSMPFAPFRKEDEGKAIDLGDYVEAEKGETKSS